MSSKRVGVHGEVVLGQDLEGLKASVGNLDVPGHVAAPNQPGLAARRGSS